MSRFLALMEASILFCTAYSKSGAISFCKKDKADSRISYKKNTDQMTGAYY